MIQYTLITNDDRQNLTLFVDGEMFVCDNTHPNFNAIIEGVLALDESVTRLFDVSDTVADVFEEITERVSVANGHVYFDGDRVDNSLTHGIIRALRDGHGYEALAKFMENLAANPNEHSKENLYRWMTNRDFTITEDGHLIAYKGVNRNYEGDFESVSSGEAFVNGERHTGRIPNFVGAVVTMPRSEVQHDPSVGCHTGLHAGTWDYASTFGGGGTLKVKINPRDVVSVPTDSSDQKMRVCRYRVLELIEKPVDQLVDDGEYDFDIDYDDEADALYIESVTVNPPVKQVEKVEKRRSYWPFSK